MSATRPTLRVERFGAEGQPVVILDDYLPNPGDFVDLAGFLPWEVRGEFYPGVRAACPSTEFPALFQPLRDVLVDVFGYSGRARVAECNFSLATTRPADLTPIQRLPHYDGLDPQRLAALLYLCPPDHGGTAFYRQRATGYETVDAPRYAPFKQALEEGVARHGLPPGYIGEGDPLFETIGVVQARFNTMVVYRGINLHCARIGEGCPFVADHRTGRLTLNAFLAEG